MPRTPLSAGLALGLLAGAAALRRESRSSDDVGKAAPLRQTLGNNQDLQYYGELSVGGQTIQGILDTGSFELLLFGKRCKSCGKAAAYDNVASGTYKKGNHSMVHGYGSGDCEAADGYDDVVINGLKAPQQPLWVTTDCYMPLLKVAKFNAVVGIGPPGEPVTEAANALKEAQEVAQSYRMHGKDVPPHVNAEIEERTQALAEVKKKKDLLDSFGVTTFSTCLGKQPGSPGFHIWNDKTRAGQPGVMELPVAGKVTWSVKLTDWRFGEGSKTVACADGCAAIVDTGTSLFAVPTDMYLGIADYLERTVEKLDCSDLRGFPDLLFTVGGKTLRFPPSSYVGKVVGEESSEAKKFIHKRVGRDEQCELLIMDIGWGSFTQMGPMLILGMPFFREYYTTFDLGAGGPEGSRSIFVSKAGPGCESSTHEAKSSDDLDEALRYTPRTVNISEVRAPTWLKPGAMRL